LGAWKHSKQWQIHYQKEVLCDAIAAIPGMYEHGLAAVDAS
jgi:hypothetical protein